MTKPTRKATIIMLEALIALALAFAIIFTLHTIAAKAEERATFTDKDGHFAGSSVTRGNTTTFTDKNGFYQGTTTRQGTPSNPLGGVNGSDPFGRRGR